MTLNQFCKLLASNYQTERPCEFESETFNQMQIPKNQKWCDENCEKICEKDNYAKCWKRFFETLS